MIIVRHAKVQLRDRANTNLWVGSLPTLRGKDADGNADDGCTHVRIVKSAFGLAQLGGNTFDKHLLRQIRVWKSAEIVYPGLRLPYCFAWLFPFPRA